MKKSPIYNLHLKNNVEFKEESGWLIPKRFNEVNKEISNVRNNQGMIDLSHRGKLRLSGKEHIKFLQGMLSNDIERLIDGKGLYATILTVKGKIISDMRVFKNNDFVSLDLEPGLNFKIKDHLLKFRLSYKAEIEDITDGYSLFHLCGPRIDQFLNSVLSSDISGLNENDFSTKKLNETQLTVIKVNRTGEKGFDLMFKSQDAQNVWTDLLEKGKEYNLKPFGLDAYEILRIEAGIPIYGKDFDETTIPIEAGLWTALSFEKGCYVGQEVIARIKWRGRVNWHLMGFIVEGDNTVSTNNKILNGNKEIGRVTSAAFSPTLSGNIALGYIRREFKEPGTEVQIQLNNNLFAKAKVVELPFLNNFT